MTFFGEEDDDFKFLAVAASIHTAVVLQKGKAYSTMSKVIMGNGGFCLNLNMFQRGGRRLHKHRYTFFLVPCC